MRYWFWEGSEGTRPKISKVWSPSKLGLEPMRMWGPKRVLRGCPRGSEKISFVNIWGQKRTDPQSGIHGHRGLGVNFWPPINYFNVKAWKMSILPYPFMTPLPGKKMYLNDNFLYKNALKIQCTLSLWLTENLLHFFDPFLFNVLLLTIIGAALFTHFRAEIKFRNC